jgi:hypothetical protein
MAASMTLLAMLFHLTSEECILPLFKQPESCTIKENRQYAERMMVMKPEKAGNDFIEHLPYIETVIFSAGGYFGGFEKTTVHFSGSQAVFDAETMNPPSAMAPAHYEGMTKSKFLTKLQSLHIEEWDEEYMAPGVLDGEQWDLEIRFSDGHRPLVISGSNAYPLHFRSLRRLMTSVPSQTKE